MIKKFFLYIILPSLVLSMVYQSGRNDGRKQAIEDGATVAEVSVTEKPVVKPMPKPKKLPAKPKTEPVDRTEKPVFVRRIPAEMIETDESVTPVTGCCSSPPPFIIRIIVT